MAKKGGQRKLKRLAAPRSWPILRKNYVWVVKPCPGPHPMELSIPLLLIIRDILGYARTAAEARKVIAMGRILVDKRPIKNYKFPVGLMDSLDILDTEEHFRVTLDRKGRIKLIRIDEKESFYKLVKIRNKTTVRGGHIQLNLHDGRNILIRVKDPTNPVEDVYKTKDSLLIELPSQKIVAHYKYEPGATVFIIGGKHVGELATLVERRVFRSPTPNRAILRDEKGNIIETIEDYVFVVGGKEGPAIKVV